MAEEAFSKTQPLWNENSNLYDIKYDNAYETKKSVWTGGSCIIQKEIIPQHQMPELAHLVVGFESKLRLFIQLRFGDSINYRNFRSVIVR